MWKRTWARNRDCGRWIEPEKHLSCIIAGVTTASAWIFSALATPQLIAGGQVNTPASDGYQTTRHTMSTRTSLDVMD
jgi:hypothetical protein